MLLDYRGVALFSIKSIARLTLYPLLANSLEYPERIQRGLEWTQLLKRLSVCSLLDCEQIGQLPRVSGEDTERIRVDSVFETSVLCVSVC